MQTDSSANRTCNESRSTSLCPAKVPIPISLQVQMMRQAISPRLATRIFRKRRCPLLMRRVQSPMSKVQSHKPPADFGPLTLDFGLTLLDSEEWLAKFDGLAVLHIDLDDFARRLGLNLVHQLHRFDNANNCVGFDVAADTDEAVCIGRWSAIERTDYGRGDEVQTLIFRGGLFSMRAGMWRSGVWGTWHSSVRGRRNRLRLTPRQDRGARWRVKISPNLYMEPFALKFEIGERVVGNKPDQFPQLVHVNRSLEMLRQRAMPATTAISITMTLGARLIRLFGSRLLRFLIAHCSFDSGPHRNLRVCWFPPLYQRGVNAQTSSI